MNIDKVLAAEKKRREAARDSNLHDKAVRQMTHSRVTATERMMYPTPASYEFEESPGIKFSDSRAGDVYAIWLECGHQVAVWDSESRPPVGSKFACLVCGPHRIGAVK